MTEYNMNDTIIPTSRYNYTTTELVIHRASESTIAILTLFSAVTNLLVFYILSNKKFGKRTSIKYLYASISISDEMFIVACLIEVALYGKSSCSHDCRRITGLTIHISGLVSSYTMALIAFKRYYGIAYPLRQFVQNRKKLPFVVAVVLIWSFSIGSTLCFVKYAPVQERNETLLLQGCTVLAYGFVAGKDHPYFPLVVMVAIPLFLGLCFSLMSIVILQRRRPIGDHVDVAMVKREKQRKMRAILMTVLVIVSFLVCWLPITLLAIVYKLDLTLIQSCNINFNLFAILTILLMMSFGTNPVIYWYMCPHFRRGIEHIFCRKKFVQQKPNSVNTLSSSQLVNRL